MKREKVNTWISTVALLLSVASCTMVFCRYAPFDNNFLSFIVAFVTLLVTLYVGAQVYHSFTLTNTLNEKSESLLQKIREENYKREENLRTEFDKKIKEKIDDYDHTVSALINQMYAITECCRNCRYDTALEYLFMALHEINSATDKAPLEGILQYLDKTIEEAKPIYELDETTINRYVKILADCGKEEAMSLIPKIYKLSHDKSHIRRT